MKEVLILAVFSSGLFACNVANGDRERGTTGPVPAQSAGIGSDAVRLIPLRHGPMIFLQVSRDNPPFANRFFSPTQVEIAAIETALAARLERDGFLDAQASAVRESLVAGGYLPRDRRDTFAVTLRSSRNREYIDLQRGLVRSIYGNFFVGRVHPGPTPAGEDRTIPTLGAGGGPTFFGAEFDITGGRITHLAFNQDSGEPLELFEHERTAQ